jgi:hypothetical protein
VHIVLILKFPQKPMYRRFVNSLQYCYWEMVELLRGKACWKEVRSFGHTLEEDIGILVLSCLLFSLVSMR